MPGGGGVSLRRLAVAAAALCGLQAFGAGDSISVNIIGGNQGLPGASIAAGLVGVHSVSAEGWNNLAAKTDSTPVNLTGLSVNEVLADKTIRLSPALVSLRAQCCYAAAGNTTSSNEGRLLYGYLDDGETESGKGAKISVSAIPYSQYTLYVYCGSDSSDGQFGLITVNDKTYPTDAAGLKWGSHASAHETSGSLTLTENQNYVKIEGLTASELVIQGATKGSPSGTRTGLAAIQIVNTGTLVHPYTQAETLALGKSGTTVTFPEQADGLDASLDYRSTDAFTSHWVFNAGLHRMTIFNGGTASYQLTNYGADDTDPWILVKSGSTLYWFGHDVGGWNRARETKALVRVEKGGVLAMRDVGGTFYFNGQVELNAGSELKLGGTEGNIRFIGGTDTDGIVVPAVAEGADAKVAKITGENLLCSASETPGFTFNVGERATLEVSAKIKDIKGSQDLYKRGAGALRLVGPIAGYGGRFQIEAGTLDFGFAAAETTVSQAIEGAGAVVKSGESTTKLTGATTYTGGTTVNAGTLAIANPNGSYTVNGGTLKVEQDVATSGAGSFAKLNLVAKSGGTVAIYATVKDADVVNATEVAVAELAEGLTADDVTVVFVNAETAAQVESVKRLDGRTLYAKAAASEGTITYVRTAATGSWTKGEGWTVNGAAATWANHEDKEVLATIDADSVSSITLDGAVKAAGVYIASTAEKTFAIEGADGGVLTTPKVDFKQFTGRLLNPSFTLAEGGVLTFGANSYVEFNVENAEETLERSYAIEGLVKKTGAGTVKLIQSGSDSSATEIAAGTLEFANANDATKAGAVSGAGKFAKSGAGTLTLTTANSFTGGLEVREGLLKTTQQRGYGPDGSAIAVKSGAALDIAGTVDMSYAITIEGAGVSGSGALVNEGAEIASTKKQTKSITLAGDATVGGTANYGLIAASYGRTYLNLAGHTLTKAGGNTFWFTTTEVQGNGTVAIESGAVRLGHYGSNHVKATGSVFDIGANGTLELADPAPEGLRVKGSGVLNLAVRPTTAIAFEEGNNVEMKVRLKTWEEAALEIPYAGVAPGRVTVLEPNGSVSSGSTWKAEDGKVKVAVALAQPPKRSNPVTGAETSFVYNYVGADEEWTTLTNWEKFENNRIVAPDKYPQGENGTYSAILIDGKTVTSATMLEGWEPRFGLFNGAKATLKFKKLQRTANEGWFMVDETSCLTIPQMGGANTEGRIDFYVAAQNGVAFPDLGEKAKANFHYYFKGDGSVKSAGKLVGTQVIEGVRLDFGDTSRPKAVLMKTLVSYASRGSTFTLANGAVTTTTEGVTPTPAAGELDATMEAGAYKLVQTDTEVQLAYVGYRDLLPVQPGEGTSVEVDTDDEAEVLALVEYQSNLPEGTDAAVVASQKSVVKLTAAKQGNGTWLVTAIIDKEKMPDGQKIDDTLYAFGAEGLDALAGATGETAVTLAAEKVTPGLYYSIRYASDLKAATWSETTRVLAKGGAVALRVPKTDAAVQFYKVAASLTAQ